MQARSDFVTKFIQRYPAMYRKALNLLWFVAAGASRREVIGES